MEAEMVPAVDVICTFLDAADTLSSTLESLRRQSNATARFILIDDGSSDASTAIARSFSSRDARFLYRRNTSPGRGRALNLGLSMAGADHVAILDADDIAHPSWLRDGLHLLRQKPEFTVVGFERVYIRGDEEVVWSASERPAGDEIEDITRDLARANVLAHSGTIMRREALAGVGGYDAARQRLFDYDLWIRFAEAGHRLGISRLVRIAKRYHGGQKFAGSPGYNLAAWREQLRAVMAIDRDYRNFVRLGLRIAADVSRRPRRALAATIKRR